MGVVTPQDSRGVKLLEGVEKRQELVVSSEPTERLLVEWVYLRKSRLLCR
jgi:hypothetical protein